MTNKTIQPKSEMLMIRIINIGILTNLMITSTIIKMALRRISKKSMFWSQMFINTLRQKASRLVDSVNHLTGLLFIIQPKWIIGVIQNRFSTPIRKRVRKIQSFFLLAITNRRDAGNMPSLTCMKMKGSRCSVQNTSPEAEKVGTPMASTPFKFQNTPI